jgi:hypothetical protein
VRWETTAAPLPVLLDRGAVGESKRMDCGRCGRVRSVTIGLVGLRVVRPECDIETGWRLILLPGWREGLVLASGWLELGAWPFCWTEGAHLARDVHLDWSCAWRLGFGSCEGSGLGSRVKKGIWWMPWRQEAMKDVARCDKLRGGASIL